MTSIWIEASNAFAKRGEPVPVQGQRWLEKGRPFNDVTDRPIQAVLSQIPVLIAGFDE